jgi:hypothetical protein
MLTAFFPAGHPDKFDTFNQKFQLMFTHGKIKTYKSIAGHTAWE